jgi:hypothetical protein
LTNAIVHLVERSPDLNVVAAIRFRGDMPGQIVDVVRREVDHNVRTRAVATP